MSIVEAIVLAIVQGLTEFLPISSSGHLVLARWLFGWEDPGLDFDVAVHVGTLAAILFAFRREVWGVLRGLRADSAHVEGLRPRRLIWLGLIGTVPIVIVGGLLYETLQDELRDATTAGAFLLVTGGLIAGAEWQLRRSGEAASLGSLDERRSLAIGVAQCLAVLPGISRSGMCMVAGMAMGQGREAAARWAFWLSMPALTGAGVLAVAALIDERESVDVVALVVGMLVSFATALVAIKALLWLVRGRSLMPFAAYCLIVGLAVLIARAAGA
ncbi:MAG: undecaprenyl-diphosphate phosphatase [Chloroflexi bacterium]|nr:undecaprenyl-diphosphate phosphatase [Chloroflexota bacterium]MCY3587393.1 undecaprenyl-diphosphate phosphatase [Chloroflexota bacterium]MCY3685325.1 undecaprenyl-diphosphate phosphatase [Chloroflexota bacterium]MDE2707521.1 undecaprenyl-diphosphate phosphatase [Chloroflexota bacterium]